MPDQAFWPTLDLVVDLARQDIFGPIGAYEMGIRVARIEFTLAYEVLTSAFG